MKKNRKELLLCILASAFGVIVLLLITLAAWRYSFFGFPDGHITEHDDIQRVVYMIYLVPMCVLMLRFFQIGIFFRKQPITKPLLKAIFIFVALFVIFLAQDYVLKFYVDHGYGG